MSPLGMMDVPSSAPSTGLGGGMGYGSLTGGFGFPFGQQLMQAPTSGKPISRAGGAGKGKECKQVGCEYGLHGLPYPSGLGKCLCKVPEDAAKGAHIYRNCPN